MTGWFDAPLPSSVCVDGCSATGPSGVTVIVGGEGYGGYSYTGATCESDSPVPEGPCIADSDGDQVCVQDQDPGCGTYNGQEYCTDDPGCGYYNGEYVCVGQEGDDSPPAPEDGGPAADDDGDGQPDDSDGYGNPDPAPPEDQWEHGGKPVFGGGGVSGDGSDGGSGGGDDNQDGDTGRDPATDPNCEDGEGSYSGHSCDAEPACTGDPILCAIAYEEWQQKCEQREWRKDLEGSDQCNSGDSLLDNTEANEIPTDTVDLRDAVDLDESGFVTGHCPELDPVSFAIAGHGLEFDLDATPLCELADLIRPLLLAFATFIAGVVVLRAVS